VSDRGASAASGAAATAVASDSRPPGAAIVVSGPSGAGKSTLLRRVLDEEPSLCFSVSHTTRTPRAGEVDGRDYYFVDEADFRARIERDEFLEWAEYQGRLYGTSRAAVEAALLAGRDVVMEVEVKGARQIRERLPDALLVIVLPPSFDALGERLRGRGSDSEDVIRKRLEIAREELREARCYSYVLINDVLERAVRDLRQIVAVARMRPQRVLPEWWKGYEPS
jgi:guanylate kinase